MTTAEKEMLVARDTVGVPGVQAAVLRPVRRAVACGHRLRCLQEAWERGQEQEQDGMLLEVATEKKRRRCSKCEFFVEKVDGCFHIVCRLLGSSLIMVYRWRAGWTIQMTRSSQHCYYHFWKAWFERKMFIAMKLNLGQKAVTLAAHVSQCQVKKSQGCQVLERKGSDRCALYLKFRILGLVQQFVCHLNLNRQRRMYSVCEIRSCCKFVKPVNFRESCTRKQYIRLSVTELHIGRPACNKPAGNCQKSVCSLQLVMLQACL